MSDAFDDKLRRALRPVDPGDSFTKSVMAKLPETIADASTPSRRKFGSRAVWAATGALAASIAAAVIGVQIIHEREEREAGLRAREQLLEALQVTSEKLNLAYRVVRDRAQGQPEHEDSERADKPKHTGV